MHAKSDSRDVRHAEKINTARVIRICLCQSTGPIIGIREPTPLSLHSKTPVVIPFVDRNSLTDLGVPIRASICFSMTKGDSDVIGFSLFFDSMIRNFAKFSCVLNIVEVSISSLSESDRGRLFVRVP